MRPGVKIFVDGLADRLIALATPSVRMISPTASLIVFSVQLEWIFFSSGAAE